MALISTRRALLGGSTAYWKKVAATGPIAYWPLWEAAGAASALDISGNGFHGTPTAVTFGATGIGDGRTAATFDGATSFINVYSAGLNAVFNGALGSAILWYQMANAGVWTDGTVRYPLYIAATFQNRIQILRLVGNNQFQYGRSGAGVGSAVTLVAEADLDWVFAAITWSEAADEFKAYKRGVQQGVTQVGLGAYAGNLAATLCCIGAGSTVPVSVHDGSVAHVALFNRVLSLAELQRLAVAG